MVANPSYYDDDDNDRASQQPSEDGCQDTEPVPDLVPNVTERRSRLIRPPACKVSLAWPDRFSFMFGQVRI